MTTEKPDNEHAIAAYIAAMQQVADLAGRVAHHAENMGDTDPERLNWRHVGSAGHAVNILNELCRHLGITKQD
jgi:hypothetical protein